MAMRTINRGFDELGAGQNAALDALESITKKFDDQAGQLSMLRSDLQGIHTQVQTLIALVTAGTPPSFISQPHQQNQQGQEQDQEGHGQPRQSIRQNQHVLSHVQQNQQEQKQQCQTQQQQQQQHRQQQQQQQQQPRKKQPGTFHCDACYAIQQERLDQEYTNDDEFDNGIGPLQSITGNAKRSSYKQAYRKLRCVRTANNIEGNSYSHFVLIYMPI
jgi:hypothetical protein